LNNIRELVLDKHIQEIHMKASTTKKQAKPKAKRGAIKMSDKQYQELQAARAAGAKEEGFPGLKEFCAKHGAH
jgi:copper homeostasis protein CutC